MATYGARAMASLASKTVLITGASSGIGRSCAKFFAVEKVRLALCARRLDALESLRSEILSLHPAAQIHVFKLDVSKKKDVDDALSALPKDFSNIDILVNNAGLAKGVAPISELQDQDFEDMIDVNVKGLVYVTKAVIRGMLERQSGHIINIGSVAGSQAYPNGATYCASKHAVAAISKSLTMELVDTPLRVSHIAPGMVNTEFSTKRYGGDQSKADAVYAGMKPLSADDIADIVLFSATRPPHVQINDLLVFPTDQASAYHVNRKN